MNTLDKVIKATQNIQTTFKEGCLNCNFYVVCKQDCYFEDLLHYLNDYKKKDKKYESALERLEESRKRYLSEYQKIEDEYDELKDWWAEEHAENVPLTWQELKQMEGKPVWVEVYEPIDEKTGWHTASWKLIEFINDEYFDVRDSDGEQECFYKSENDCYCWQAYRKERK